MQIRLTMTFDIDEETKFNAAAELEKRAAALGVEMNKTTEATVASSEINFPTGPKAKKTAK